MALSPDHPVVAWARREIAPPLRERLRPERILLFDPPDRPASAGTAPPGLLVVAAAFEGIPVPERVAIVRGLLADSSPVRPLCLTPAEAAVAERVPGPVLAAARTGIEI